MSYSVSRADLEGDREEILKLWERNLPTESSNIEKYKWYYQGNPFGPGICCLLRHNESGRIVGTAGLGLHKVKIFDKICLAGIASDFAVNREHRTFLPALMLQKAVLKAAEKEVDLIYGLPNNRATGVMLRAGYKKIGEMVRYAKVLDLRPYVSHTLKGLGGIKTLTTPVNWVFSLLSHESWCCVEKNFIAKEIENVDSRFDVLWKLVSPCLSVAGERTSIFLRWRYLLCPLKKYHIFGLFSRDEEKILGYIIFSWEQKRVDMVDIFFDINNDILKNLLTGFIKLARKMDGESISFNFLRTNPQLKLMTDFGFYERKDYRDAVMYGGLKNKFIPECPDWSNWYFTSGDEDFN